MGQCRASRAVTVVGLTMTLVGLSGCGGSGPTAAGAAACLKDTIATATYNALIQLGVQQGGHTLYDGLGVAAANDLDQGYPGTTISSSATAKRCSNAKDWAALRHISVVPAATCTAGGGNSYTCLLDSKEPPAGTVGIPTGTYSVTYDGQTITYKRE